MYKLEVMVSQESPNRKLNNNNNNMVSILDEYKLHLEYLNKIQFG